MRFAPTPNQDAPTHNATHRPAPCRHGPVFTAAPWQPDALALLDHEHLVAWADRPADAARFAAAFAQHLAMVPGILPLTLQGRSITSLDTLCAQLERLVPVDRLDRTIEGPRGLIDLLRDGSALPGALRRRVFLWTDPDILARADADLFARVLDAFFGVAAEDDFGPSPAHYEQRLVLVGSPRLAELAQRAPGPCTAWHRDHDHDEPFWQTITGQDAPRVLCAHTDILTQTDRHPRRLGIA